MAWTKTYDGAEPQRVNKWLAQAGVCSRREAEALIEAGAVLIDGERVEDVGRKIAPGQTLTVADRGEAELGAAVSVVINKPVGIVSAQPEHGQTPSYSDEQSRARGALRGARAMRTARRSRS